MSQRSKLGLTYDIEGHIAPSILEQLGAPKSADFYLCGPATFNESLSGDLKAWGVEAARIHVELFGPGESLAPAVIGTILKKPHAPEGQQGGRPKVTFTKSGLTVPWASRFHSILESAKRVTFR